MRPIFDTCVPWQDILAGTFNPEIFTGSLPQMLDHSHGRTATIDNMHNDSGQFFTKRRVRPTS